MQLLVDNMVYEIGRKVEIEAEIKIEEAKIKRQDTMFEALMRMLAGR